MALVTLDDVGEGDVVRASFDPPLVDPQVGTVVSVRGKIRTAAGMKWLASAEHSSSWGMPHLFDLLPEPPGLSLVLEETAGAVKERNHLQARGALVYPFAPKSARDVERQLTDLAEMTLAEEDRAWGGRRDQLKHQFNDVADLVHLARSKREYLFTRARLGRDFHPWTVADERVIRIETVRPLPCDFELDRRRRIDRERRLEEAVMIFGAAERETRQIASALRARGWEVRRPHPNAQELLIRVTMGTMRGEAWAKPSRNGLWGVEPWLAHNKKEERARARMIREGHFAQIAKDVDGILEGLGLA